MATLDEELAELLSPLVPLNPRLAVSPYLNTLCIAYHYRLAYGEPVPDDRISLIDWNLDYSSPHFISALVGKDVTGFHIFYNTQDTAFKLKRWVQSGAGYYNSLPVTNYRQRSVFIRRNNLNEAFVRNREGQPVADIAKELLTGGEIARLPFIITDLREQAKALARAVLGRAKLPPIVYPNTLQGYPGTSDEEAAMFVFSGPSTEYMTRKPEHFIRLDVDDLPTLQEDDFYKTHIIWHVPRHPKSDHNLIVSRCLDAYHRRLFQAAQEGRDADFEGMASSIGLTLTARHPSFRSLVFQTARDFREGLLNHHSDPP